VNGGGTAMQRAYVNIAVCGPSRASMLTSRRPDSTHVGLMADKYTKDAPHWCWCRRSNCKQGELFMTLPTYMKQHGYITAGNGKLFHPDACRGAGDGSFTHDNGDDPRGYSVPYHVEANYSQMEWGTIPGPTDPVWNHTMGRSWMISDLTDEQQTDGMLATNGVETLARFASEGIGKGDKPFFLNVGLHKPHLPHIVPKHYFDMYPLDKVSLAPNQQVPQGFKQENWYNSGEIRSYNYNAGPRFQHDNASFVTPVDDQFSREQRRGYFAATSFMDAQVGRVLRALTTHGYKENTVVVLWGDHGWHLGDTNSWGKMTNFESATHNTMLWRVPGQSEASKGRQTRMVEAIDIFPTILELTGTQPPPSCQGMDQPPTVECLQGESYASLFNGQPDVGDGNTSKQFAFSQWPQSDHRMGYTVRSSKGFRLTEYVPYKAMRVPPGDWSGIGDIELYDYNMDPWEFKNHATNQTYIPVIAELRDALRAQFAGGTMPSNDSISPKRKSF